MPATSYIYTLAEEQIKPRISIVEGVYSVNIYGATPQEWEIIYDQEKLAAIGVSSSAISSSINNYLLEREIGGATETSSGGLTKRTYLTLTGNCEDIFRWDDIPVANPSGRIIHLTDVAKIKLKDQRPQKLLQDKRTEYCQPHGQCREKC